MAWTNILYKNSTHVYMRPSASESLSFPLSDRILPTGPTLHMQPAGPKITLRFPRLFVYTGCIRIWSVYWIW